MHFLHALQYVIIRIIKYVKLTRSMIILMFLLCRQRSGGCWTSKNNNVVIVADVIHILYNIVLIIYKRYISLYYVNLAACVRVWPFTCLITQRSWDEHPHWITPAPSPVLTRISPSDHSNTTPPHPPATKEPDPYSFLRPPPRCSTQLCRTATRVRHS